MPGLLSLTKIVAKNFRGFSSEGVSLEFHPHFTLLLGANGAGKTSALEAVAVGLGALSAVFPEFSRRDVRPEEISYRAFSVENQTIFELQRPVAVELSGTAAGEPIGWPYEPFHPILHSPIVIRSELVSFTTMRDAVAQGVATPLPVVAYYGAQRSRGQSRSRDIKRPGRSRFDGYLDCLEAIPDANLFTEWMAWQTTVQLQSREEVAQLQAVERAVCQCIESKRFWYDFKQDGLCIEQNDGSVLLLSSMSDGYRGVIFMVADLAWRAAVLNPQHRERAAELAEGVVLIDELELHLHPRWQRRVVGDLRRTFPNMQFIATTHSPQILASVDRDQVRVLQDHQTTGLHTFVHGRDSNELLEDVFGVSSRPEAMQKRLDQLFLWLDQERYAEASALYDELASILGPEDHAMVKARWTLDVEAGSWRASMDRAEGG